MEEIYKNGSVKSDFMYIKILNHMKVEFINTIKIIGLCVKIILNY